MGVNIWEQFPREPAAAYAAFVQYLGLGPNRTIAAAFDRTVAEIARGNVGTPITDPPDFSIFDTWSIEWVWAERAAAYDHDQRCRKLLEQQAEREAHEQKTHTHLRALEDRLSTMQLGVARAIENLLSAGLDKFTYQHRDGPKVATETADNLRTLRGLCAAESALARLYTHLDQQMPSVTDAGTPGGRTHR